MAETEEFVINSFRNAKVVRSIERRIYSIFGYISQHIVANKIDFAKLQIGYLADVENVLFKRQYRRE